MEQFRKCNFFNKFVIERTGTIKGEAKLVGGMKLIFPQPNNHPVLELGVSAPVKYGACLSGCTSVAN